MEFYNGFDKIKEKIEFFDFERVDFDNPMSILNYGNDILKLKAEITEIYKTLLSDDANSFIDFDEQTKIVTELFNNYFKSQDLSKTKKNSKNNLAKDNIIDKIFSKLEKLLNNSDKETIIKNDSYMDIVSKFNSQIDELCARMLETSTSITARINITHEYCEILKLYMSKLNECIQAGEVETKKYLEQLEQLEKDSNNLNYVNIGKNYVNNFKNKLFLLRKSLAETENVYLTSKATIHNDMQIVMNYNTFINVNANDLKERISSDVIIHQQNDMINSQHQLLDAVSTFEKKAADTLRENVSKVAELNNSGNKSIDILQYVRTSTLECLQLIQTTQNNALEQRKKDNLLLEQMSSDLSKSATILGIELTSDASDTNLLTTFEEKNQKILTKSIK